MICKSQLISSLLPHYCHYLSLLLVWERLDLKIWSDWMEMVGHYFQAMDKEYPGILYSLYPLEMLSSILISWPSSYSQNCLDKSYNTCPIWEFHLESHKRLTLMTLPLLNNTNDLDKLSFYDFDFNDVHKFLFN